jgi:hypothetical protein
MQQRIAALERENAALKAEIERLKAAQVLPEHPKPRRR